MSRRSRQRNVRAFTLLFWVSLSVLLSGCGESSGGEVVARASGSSGADAPATDVPDDRRPELLKPLQPYEKSQPVDATGYERSRVRALWRLSEVEADDQTIKVSVVTGGCLYFSHMTVEDTTDSALVIAAWNDKWTPLKENYICNASLEHGQYRVRLSEPLDGRKLEGQCTPGGATVAERQCPDGRFVAPPTAASSSTSGPEKTALASTSTTAAGTTAGTEKCVEVEGGAGDNNQPVTLRVCASTTIATVGEEVAFSVNAADPDARLFPLSECMPNGIYFGEGPQCSVTPGCAPRSEPVAAEPGNISQEYRRSFAKAGLYPVSVQVQSGSQCSHPYASSATAKIDIFVRDT